MLFYAQQKRKCILVFAPPRPRAVILSKILMQNKRIDVAKTKYLFNVF